MLECEENESFILYPGKSSVNLSEPASAQLARTNKNRVIFILDATWPCAKKMLKLSKNLQKLHLLVLRMNKSPNLLLNNNQTSSA